MEETELTELKELIKLSRKRELNFAMCLGKTHKELVLLMHRIRSQEVLMRKARKMDGAIPAKYTIGTVKTKGRKIMLTCSVEPPPGTARILRRFFIWADMPMQIILLDQSGGVVEEDTEDEDDTPQPKASSASAKVAQEFEGLDKARSDRIGEEGISKAMGKWRQARRMAGPKIVAYAKGKTPDAAGVGQSWEKALKLGDSQNKPVEAFRMLERIVSRIKASSAKAGASAQPAAPSKSEQMREFKVLARKVRRKIEAGAPADLRKTFVDAVKLAQRGDPATALDMLDEAARASALR
ncbi:MAG: hypothetical protein AAGB05_16815 [Pseudomonadota bacterium]